MVSEWVPIGDAAQQLGLSVDAMRRRVKRGEVCAEKRATPQGGAWWVRMVDTTPDAVQVAPDGALREVANGAVHLAPGGGDGASRHAPGGTNGTTGGSAVARESEWAPIVRDLAERLERANADLLARTEAAAAWQGRADVLASELAKTRDQLALMAPKAEPEPPRRWWTFWRD